MTIMLIQSMLATRRIFQGQRLTERNAGGTTFEQRMVLMIADAGWLDTTGTTASQQETAIQVGILASAGSLEGFIEAIDRHQVIPPARKITPLQSQ